MWCKTIGSDELKISVVIATCGRPELLSIQLNSILNQSVLPDEIIITEDQPSDGSGMVVSELDFGTIKVHFFENEKKLGMVQNFGLALSKATGDLIFLCDDDDIWLKDKIKFMSQQMLNNDSLVICYHDVEFFDGTNASSGLTKYQNYKRLGIPVSSLVMGSASCFRRKLLLDILPIPEFEIGHDDWISFVSKCNGGFLHFDRVLQKYRRHNTNMSVIPENDTSQKSIFGLFRRYSFVLSKGYRHEMMIQNMLNQKRLKCIKERSKTLNNIDLVERWVRDEENRLEMQSLSHLRRFPIIMSKIIKGHYRDKPWRNLVRDIATF